MIMRKPEYDEANWTRIDTPRGRRPTGIDCPMCGAEDIFVTSRLEFAWGWFLVVPLVYLIYHFMFKPRGGRCSDCGEKLPDDMR